MRVAHTTATHHDMELNADLAVASPVLLPLTYPLSGRRNAVECYHVLRTHATLREAFKVGN